MGRGHDVDWWAGFLSALSWGLGDERADRERGADRGAVGGERAGALTLVREGVGPQRDSGQHLGELAPEPPWSPTTGQSLFPSPPASRYVSYSFSTHSPHSL